MSTQALGQQADMRPRSFLAWLALATLLALGLRLFLLGSASFWVDEIYSVMHASRLGEGNVSKQFGFVPTYLALKLAGALPGPEAAMDPSSWQSLGITETLVRMPSVVIGVLTIPILGWLARPVVGARVAVFFAFLLAVSTWHLHMSQTGRFYAQQMLFFNMAMLLYVHARLLGSVPRLVAALACLFLAFMSQPPAILLGIVFGIDWLIGLRGGEDKKYIIRSAVLGGITAVIIAAVLAWDISHRTKNWADFGKSTSQSAPVVLAGAIWFIHPAVAFVSATGFLYMAQRELRLACYLALCALVPLLVMAALAFSEFFVHTRYTFVILPAWLLLAAVALSRAMRPSLSEYPLFIRAIPMAAIVIASMYQNFEYYTAGGYQPAWREAFAELDRRRQPGEPIFGDFHAEMLGAYYLQESAITVARKATLDEKLDAVQGPCWVIDKTGTGGGLFWPQLRERADLIWVFDRNIIQPYSSIKLFQYTPPAQSAGSE